MSIFTALCALTDDLAGVPDDEFDAAFDFLGDLDVSNDDIFAMVAVEEWMDLTE